MMACVSHGPGLGLKARKPQGKSAGSHFFHSLDDVGGGVCGQIVGVGGLERGNRNRVAEILPSPHCREMSVIAG